MLHFRLEDRRSKVAGVTGNFRTNELSRMERIQRKLQAVTVSSKQCLLQHFYVLNV